MMRRIAPVLACVLIAACDDPQRVDRAPSDFHVQVYVERDDSVGMGEADTPLRADVTVEGQERVFEAADSTGPDGIVAFLELTHGAYTVSHEPSALPTGLELVGSYRQTVVAPPAGDSVVARFVYRDTTTVIPPEGVAAHD